MKTKEKDNIEVIDKLIFLLDRLDKNTKDAEKNKKYKELKEKLATERQTYFNVK